MPAGEGAAEAARVLEESARTVGAGLEILGRDFVLKPDGAGAFVYQDAHTTLGALELGLVGEHQLRNAALALAAVGHGRSYGLAISNDAVRRGLKDVRWPARLERVARDPDVLLDCAHNPDAARALAAALEV